MHVAAAIRITSSIRFAFLIGIGTLVLGYGAAGAAQDLSGTYSGALQIDPDVAVKATLSQSQGRLRGSIELTPPNARLAGAYAVRGVTDGTRLWVFGVAGNRARLWYRAEVVGNSIS